MKRSIPLIVCVFYFAILLSPGIGQQYERTADEAIRVENGVVDEFAAEDIDEEGRTTYTGETDMGDPHVGLRAVGDEIEPIHRSESVSTLADTDPVFACFVDFSLLEEAMSDLNAGLLADVALMLAEAERVLLRTHASGVTAEKLVAKATTLALRNNDERTLQRLEGAAKRSGNESWTKSIAEAKEFASASCAPGPSIAIDKLDAETLDIANVVRRMTTTAILTNQSEHLENLKFTVSESLGDGEIKEYLLKTIDDAVAFLPQRDEASAMDATAKLLREFESSGRGRSSWTYWKKRSGSYQLQRTRYRLIIINYKGPRDYAEMRQAFLDAAEYYEQKDVTYDFESQFRFRGVSSSGWANVIVAGYYNYTDRSFGYTIIRSIGDVNGSGFRYRLNTGKSYKAYRDSWQTKWWRLGTWSLGYEGGAVDIGVQMGHHRGNTGEIRIEFRTRRA